MAEFCNDANTFCLVEDTRTTFTIQAGGRSGTPTLEIPIVNGNIVRVTAQFVANNTSGNGFGYKVIATSSDARAIGVRGVNTFSGAPGWQVCQRDDIFLITLPPNVAQDDATFEINFSEISGAVSAEAGSLILMAQIIGSSLIPA